MIKYSLIIGTLDRHQELDVCVEALLRQTYDNYEIIIVDQSADNYSNIQKKSSKIKYIQIKEKGLSHARNIGVSISNGDYICLVDDDGIYNPEVLEKANSIIEMKKPLVLGGRIEDPQTGKTITDIEEAKVSWSTAFKYLVSPSMIINRDFLNRYMFDERFGVGTSFGSGEETDIVFAALKEKGLVYYTNKYTVNHHVDSSGNPDDRRIEKYSYGRGALLKKVSHNYSLYWGSILFIRSYIFNLVAGYIVLPFVDKRKGKLRRIKAKNLLKGFFEYK